MHLKRVFGILHDRVRVGPDRPGAIPSTELQLYVDESGALLALSPEQASAYNDVHGKPNAEPDSNESQLPLTPGYQQESV